MSTNDFELKYAWKGEMEYGFRNKYDAFQSKNAGLYLKNVCYRRYISNSDF